MSEKYIPENCWLTCNKGSNPVRIKVTHNNNTNIYGEKLVSEADMVPGENITPFGSCAITNGSCAYNPLYWDKCNEGVKVNGYKLVFKDAHLLCRIGGQIGVDFTVPGGNAGSLLVGSGYGLFNALTDFEAMAPNLIGVDALVPPNQLRWSQTYGNSTFGDGRPLEPLRDNILRSGNAYGQMEPLTVVRMEDGGLTSLDHRRGIAAINAGSKEVPVKIMDSNAPFPEEYGSHLPANKTVAKKLGVNVGDTPQTYGDAARYRSAGQSPNIAVAGSTDQPKIRMEGPDGTKIKVPISEGLKAPSRADQLIGKVTQSISEAKLSQTIRNSGKVIAANEFLAANATKIARIGKVAGRGAIVLGIIADGYSIYSAYEEEGKFGEKTKAATGSAVGGLAGGIAGAELGAMIGTAICPGIGTVAGGIVGGIIGGIAGSSLGSTIAGWF